MSASGYCVSMHVHVCTYEHVCWYMCTHEWCTRACICVTVGVYAGISVHAHTCDLGLNVHVCIHACVNWAQSVHLHVDACVSV